MPIASGLENTGRYAWPIDSRTPPQFYLRLEVRDEAGNVGVHETTDPVTIDQSRPTIRVRDVHPVGQPDAAPPLARAANRKRRSTVSPPPPLAPRALYTNGMAEKPIPALDYLAKPEKYPPGPVCALFGDESFLRRQAILCLRTAVLGGDDGDFSL